MITKKNIDDILRSFDIEIEKFRDILAITSVSTVANVCLGIKQMRWNEDSYYDETQVYYYPKLKEEKLQKYYNILNDIGSFNSFNPQLSYIYDLLHSFEEHYWLDGINPENLPKAPIWREDPEACERFENELLEKWNRQLNKESNGHDHINRFVIEVCRKILGRLNVEQCDIEEQSHSFQIIFESVVKYISLSIPINPNEFALEYKTPDYIVDLLRLTQLGGHECRLKSLYYDKYRNGLVKWDEVHISDYKEIPAIGTVKLVELAENLFDHKPIKRLFLPNTIRTIKWSFWNCWDLEYIGINSKFYYSIDGVVYQGNSLFAYPRKHGTQYRIIEGTKIILKDSFKNCYIKELIIPSSVEIIETNAFYRCNSLERIICLRDGNKKLQYNGLYGDYGTVSPKWYFIDINQYDSYDNEKKTFVIGDDRGGDCQ